MAWEGKIYSSHYQLHGRRDRDDAQLRLEEAVSLNEWESTQPDQLSPSWRFLHTVEVYAHWRGWSWSLDGPWELLDELREVHDDCYAEQVGWGGLE